jgi:hypothetical protein
MAENQPRGTPGMLLMGFAVALLMVVILKWWMQRG